MRPVKFSPPAQKMNNHVRAVAYRDDLPIGYVTEEAGTWTANFRQGASLPNESAELSNLRSAKAWIRQQAEKMDMAHRVDPAREPFIRLHTVDAMTGANMSRVISALAMECGPESAVQHVEDGEHVWMPIDFSAEALWLRGKDMAPVEGRVFLVRDARAAEAVVDTIPGVTRGETVYLLPHSSVEPEVEPGEAPAFG